MITASQNRALIAMSRYNSNDQCVHIQGATFNMAMQVKYDSNYDNYKDAIGHIIDQKTFETTINEINRVAEGHPGNCAWMCANVWTTCTLGASLCCYASAANSSRARIAKAAEGQSRNLPDGVKFETAGVTSCGLGVTSLYMIFPDTMKVDKWAVKNFFSGLSLRQLAVQNPLVLRRMGYAPMSIPPQQMVMSTGGGGGQVMMAAVPLQPMQAGPAAVPNEQGKAFCQKCGTALNGQRFCGRCGGDSAI